jgi:CAAX protease family protein
VTAAPADRRRDARWIATFAATLVAALIAVYATEVFLRIPPSPRHHFDSEQLSIIIGVRETAALAVVWLAAARYLHASRADLGLVRPRWRQVALGAGLAVVFGLTITPLIVATIPDPTPNAIYNSIADGSLAWRLVALLVLGVYSPFVQELVFRGVLLTGMLRSLGAPVAIVGSAAIFGLVHWPSGPSWVVNAFAIGIVQGVLYLRFRTLTPAIAMHVTTNTLGTGLYIALLQHAGR